MPLLSLNLVVDGLAEVAAAEMKVVSSRVRGWLVSTEWTRRMNMFFRAGWIGELTWGWVRERIVK